MAHSLIAIVACVLLIAVGNLIHDECEGGRWLGYLCIATGTVGAVLLVVLP